MGKPAQKIWNPESETIGKVTVRRRLLLRVSTVAAFSFSLCSVFYAYVLQPEKLSVIGTVLFWSTYALWTAVFLCVCFEKPKQVELYQYRPRGDQPPTAPGGPIIR